MKKIRLFIIPILALAFTSCDDYFNINDNPNDLHADVTKPSMFLPAAQVGAYRVQATTMTRLGLLFSNAAGGNVQSYASPFSDEMTLNVSTNFYSAIFENLYINVNTFQKVIDYPNPTGQYSGEQAVAKICKAYYMQYIVDLYGDAPYTDAFKGQANLTPKYNDDQLIYKKLLTELDEARAMIADIQGGVNTNAEDISTVDVMLHGDMAKWNEFANTVELKMLVRMSNSTGATAAWRDARLNDLAANGATFTTYDVTINPGYSADNDAQVNPFVFNFGWDSAANVTNRNVYCISGHLLKCLNPLTDVNYASPAEQEVIAGSGVFYPLVSDPRRYRIFATAATAAPYHKGVTQGSTTVDVFRPGGNAIGQPSKIAGYMFNPYGQNGVSNGLPNTSVGNFHATNSGYVMTGAESYFLQAEAAHLGGAYAVLGLDAATSFDNGVNASFPFYQLAPSATYLTTIKTKPNFGYNVAFTAAQNHHAILYQKWIAEMQSNPIEAYIDNTRTGYPVNPMSLSADASKTTRPKRLIYPTSEYIANAANVPNVTSSDIFTAGNPKLPFWQLGDPALGN
jgi:hypothetical protein